MFDDCDDEDVAHEPLFAVVHQPGPCSYLTHVDLSFVGLDKLPTKLPRGLKFLNCSYNDIAELPDDLPPNLVHMDVSHNKLTRLGVGMGSLDKLVGLYASNNALISLDDLPPNLLALNVSHNFLVALPLILPIHLVQIDVTNNRLERFPVQLPDFLTVFRACGNSGAEGVSDAYTYLSDVDGALQIDDFRGKVNRWRNALKAMYLHCRGEHANYPVVLSFM